MMSIEQIAEAISRHDFASTYVHMAESIRWNLVGGEQLAGREAVMLKCDEMKAYLSTVTTTFEQFRLIAAADCVVIDTVAEYVDDGKKRSRIASCDIYQFVDGTLDDITSYNIELPAGD